MIAREDGDHSATVDAAGAAIGGIALAAFGAASWWLLPNAWALPAEAGALVAWLLAFGIHRVLGRRVSRTAARAP